MSPRSLSFIQTFVLNSVQFMQQFQCLQCRHENPDAQIRPPQLSIQQNGAAGLVQRCDSRRNSQASVRPFGKCLISFSPPFQMTSWWAHLQRSTCYKMPQVCSPPKSSWNPNFSSLEGFCNCWRCGVPRHPFICFPILKPQFFFLPLQLGVQAEGIKELFRGVRLEDFSLPDLQAILVMVSFHESLKQRNTNYLFCWFFIVRWKTGRLCLKTSPPSVHILVCPGKSGSSSTSTKTLSGRSSRLGMGDDTPRGSVWLSPCWKAVPRSRRQSILLWATTAPCGTWLAFYRRRLPGTALSRSSSSKHATSKRPVWDSRWRSANIIRPSMESLLMVCKVCDGPKGLQWTGSLPKSLA